MEGRQCTANGPGKTERTRWNRREAAACQQSAERLRCGASERTAAKLADVPRSTLRNWSCRTAQIDLPAGCVDFFESADGVDLLHRVLVAAHLVFGEVGPCGTRPVAKFIQLTGLDRFIGTSYGCQYDFRVQLEQALVEFGEEERARLASQMSPREITVCQDETFHPQTCLVAMEPLSNFILLEEYAANRTSETWGACMRDATQDMAVTIVQSTSDEGRSLVKHCRVGLGAHHSPDLFHIQKDVSHAFGGKTNGAVKRAETELRQVCQETARLRAEGEALGPTHAALFEQQIQLSQEEEKEAAARVEAAKTRRQEVRDEVRGIGDDYHPFDLQTGEPQDADDVERTLNTRFDSAKRLANQFEVPKGGRKSIAKARKNVGNMVATIAYFWQIFLLKATALKLPDELRQSLASTLLAATYLDFASRRASKAEQRQRLQALSQSLYAKARDGPLRCLDPSQQEAVEQMIAQCAGLFQRSSSCVEGRNGQLALHHHGLHRLSTRKLNALTTVHNYFIQRADGTTAAQRFFGAPPRDLFDWLLKRLSLPPRPRCHRA
jgi:hypothetical protein